MIIFKKLRYKNFLSTGDNFTEIQLNRSRSTLVVGQNGAGKSTMLDALSFALFGKAHRSITKNQLINSINGKATVVEVEFSVGVSEYKIHRGIKPNTFEIWKDNVLVNQDSHNKEYQSVLEKNILKLNHKSFHQIVVLGSSSFVPFMQLPAQHRRDVIEDLLDINVFSKMNGILKERMSVLREKGRTNQVQLELIRDKIKNQERYVNTLRQLSSEQKAKKQVEITELGEKIDERIATNTADLEHELTQVKSQLAKINKQRVEFEKYDHQFQVKQKELAKEIKFYESNDICPTCDQDIEESLKSAKTAHARTKGEELEEGRTQASTKINELDDRRGSVETHSKQLVSAINDVHISNAQVNEWQKRMSVLQNDLIKIDEETASIDEALEAKAELEASKQVLHDEHIVIADEGSYGVVIAELLKDTGIKTKIIKQYLPVINKLTNQYLQILDFYVSFDLDDTFKETIRSRHRDSFSYDSFSEGEKQRIDLALLFTWRMIAKMKNSVATNLLILDETFDSSLDADGVDNLTKIIDSMDGDSSIFVISHKGAILEQYFDSKIEFIKEKNFSKVA